MRLFILIFFSNYYRIFSNDFIYNDPGGINMIVYGKNIIKEAIYASRPIFNMYVDQKFNDHKFLSFLKEKDIRFESVSKEKLNQLSNNQNHQGIVANVKDMSHNL